MASAKGLADLEVLPGASSVLSLARLLCGAGGVPQIGDYEFSQHRGPSGSWTGEELGTRKSLCWAVAILLCVLTPAGGRTGDRTGVP